MKGLKMKSKVIDLQLTNNFKEKLFLRFLKKHKIYHAYQCGYFFQRKYNKVCEKHIKYLERVGFRNLIIDAFPWGTFNLSYKTDIYWGDYHRKLNKIIDIIED